MDRLSQLEDDRADAAALDVKPEWYGITATDKQLNLIKRLLRQQFLFKSDFSEWEYYHKKSMDISRASELIGIGLARKEELRVERILSVFD